MTVTIPEGQRAKIIARILGSGMGKKIEDELGEYKFGFRRLKTTRDAFGILRISEQNFEHR
jgi:hypothetical protein